MDEADADRKAEMPEDSRKGRGGTSPGMGRERQAPAAVEDTSPPETTMLLEEVLRRENLVKAYHRVRTNKGAAGVDGMTVDDLKPCLKEHWPRIKEEILTGSYQPQPARRVDIPEPGGNGDRSLGIPIVLDRFIEQAILQVFTPIFDPHFLESSYGFRPGRSAHDAVLKARRVKDKRLLKLIRRYLTSGIMYEGVVQVQEEGTPQGSPRSLRCLPTSYSMNWTRSWSEGGTTSAAMLMTVTSM
jgi:RNA-directed DNA polymerase